MFGLEFLIPLVWSFVAPVLVEGVKKATGLATVKKIPKNIIPAIGMGLGAGAAMIFPEAGMTETMGASAGLAGTGVHQMINASKYVRK
jgi:hypothetical protein